MVMTSLWFIGPPKILGTPLNLALPLPQTHFFGQVPTKIRGAATMIVLQNRVCLPFRSSFHLYVSFLGISSLFFSETQHAVRGPSLVLYDSCIFWKTSLLGKNDQKWSKMTQKRVLWLFKKIMSLVLSGICVKWKFLRFINNLRKLHAWEKPGSQVIVKNGSWPMRFQYSLIVNISLID